MDTGGHKSEIVTAGSSTLAQMHLGFRRKARHDIAHQMDANVPSFLRSWSDQLHSASDQVRHLIGDRHWLSDGRHKERLLADFLSAHLPAVCSVAGGFVFPILKPGNVSREVDILVTDKQRSAALLASRDLVIVPPSGLVAHVHVKSDLTKQTFDDALGTAETVMKTIPPSGTRTPFAALFFFTQSKPLRQNFFSSFRGRIAELLNEKRSSGFAVCAGRNLFAVGKPAVDGKRARLVVFELEKLAAGAFLANVLTAVESYFEGASRRPELLQAVASISAQPAETIEL
jgi:hypothetical protein